MHNSSAAQKPLAIKVILAEDHTIVRDALKTLLHSTSSIQVAGEAPDGRQAVNLAVQLKPDVVVMDIMMKDMNGIDATREIHRLCPQIRILALSMHTAPHMVKSMLLAGASGYLSKDCANHELVSAIQALARGQLYFGQGVGDWLLGEFRAMARNLPSDATPDLDSRERQILQLLAEGKNTKEISLTIGLSTKTVDACRHQLMDRLGIDNIPQLTKYAIHHKLTDLELGSGI
jgi:DNA-binding NarL/FixJ family response regulator